MTTSHIPTKRARIMGRVILIGSGASGAKPEKRMKQKRNKRYFMMFFNID
jgi:hypothetical protein